MNMYKNTYTTSTAGNTTFGNIKTNKNSYSNTCIAGDTYTVSEAGIPKIVSVEISIQYDEEALKLPDCCKNCPNRPSKQNGYTSICWCALPALTNPITV